MLEIKNIFFNKRKKQIYQNFSLTLKNQEILTCLYKSKKEKHIFLNILQGKKYPYNGDIKLNNIDITTFNKTDRKIIIIKSHNIFSLFFIPVKLKLMWHTITNPAFIYDSLNEYFSKISDNKNIFARNEQQIFLLDNLNKLLNHEIKSIINKNLSNTNQFLEKIDELHDKNVEELLMNNANKLTKKWIKTYLSKKTEILITQNLLIFFQALYDLTSEFKELRLSCDCEKYIRNEKIKISKKEFYYHELDKIVDHQLNQISVEIIKKRYEIFLLKNKINRYKKIIKINLKKYEKNKKIYKLIKFNIINYKKNRVFSKKQNESIKIVSNLEDEFLTKEKLANNNILSTDFMLLKNKIVELVHSYHVALLEENVINISKKEYKEKMKTLNSKYNSKSEVKKIYSLMMQEVDNITLKLGIKKKNIFSNIFSPELSKILTALINGLLSKKEIVVLDRLFDKLIIKEQQQLKEIIDKMFVHFPKTKLIIFSNNILYNNTNITKYLLLTDYDNSVYDQTTLDKNYISNPKNLIWYKSIFNASENIFTYNKAKKISLDFSLFLNNISDIQHKIICINPKYIFFERFNVDDIKLEGKIQSVKQKKSNFYLVKFKVFSNNIKIKILKQHFIKKDSKINNIYINKKHILIYSK